MEDASSQIVAGSKLFEFIVGPDKKEFTIHSALLACQSSELQVLVNRPFKESAKRSVIWDDIDVEIFVSFWEFVYHKDYYLPKSFFTEPKAVSEKSVSEEAVSEQAVSEDSLAQLGQDESHEIASEQAASEPAASEPAASEPAASEPAASEQVAPKQAVSEGFSLEWAIPLSFERKKKLVKKHYKDIFKSWRDFRDSWRLELSDSSVDKPPEKAELIPDYAAILVHHARVYVLADRYHISRLMNMSLLKLHQALMEIQLCGDRVDDVLFLLSYCYTEGRPPKLRRLVAHYTACHLTKFWERDEFRDMVEEHGALPRDFLEYVMLRRK